MRADDGELSLTLVGRATSIAGHVAFVAAAYREGALTLVHDAGDEAGHMDSRRLHSIDQLPDEWAGRTDALRKE